MGLRKLAAPPTSKSHVLSDIQRLKAKLAQENSSSSAKPIESVMDMLIDLDIKSEPIPHNNNAHMLGSTP